MFLIHFNTYLKQIINTTNNLNINILSSKMSTISKFYQITNFLLLEYRTDQYAILNGESTPNDERTDIYMYVNQAGQQCVLDMLNFKYTQFIDDAADNYYFPGIYDKNILSINEKQILSKSDKAKQRSNNLIVTTVNSDTHKKTETIIGQIIHDASSPNNKIRKTSALRDYIRIYFCIGYFMNALQGLSVKMTAPVKIVSLTPETKARLTELRIPKSLQPLPNKRIQDNITLLDWYIPKQETNKSLQMLYTPLYYNSKFYDRYIEIPVLSPYDLALNAINRNIDYVYTENYKNLDDENETAVYRGYIDVNSPAQITISTVSTDYQEYIDKVTEEQKYTLDPGIHIPVTHDTNSKYFNVELYEDEETGTIVYYPVYGEPSVSAKMKPFNLEMMIQIETNTIPMYDRSDYDNANDGIDEFIEYYGENAFKWCIINELSVTYQYQYIVQADQTGSPAIQPIQEYYTNTIDYTGKTLAHGDFWKSKFMPFVQDRPYQYCSSIAIRYTAHLYNRMNQREIVRSASMVIENPMKYSRKVINTAAINNYKVVNKIIQNNGVNNVNVPIKIKEVEKIVPVFYTSNDIHIKVNNDVFTSPQNTLTLKLKKGPNMYAFSFYNAESSYSTLTPFNISNYSQFKLIFPLSKRGEQLVYNAVTNYDSFRPSDGKLIFYISADDAETIMGFQGEHLFRITCAASSGKMETTMYTGQVAWDLT